MDKSTKNTLILGGLGVAAWYLISKSKDAKAEVKPSTYAKDEFGMPQVMPEPIANRVGNANTGVASPRRPPMITDKLSENEIKRIKNEIQRQKPPLGKYKLTGNVSHTVKRDNGLQQVIYPSKLYQFRAGDVVNAKEARFTDSEMTWYLLVEVGGQDRPFPLNMVSKVNDSTPVTTPKVTEEKNDNSMQVFRMFSARQALTLDNLLG